MRAWNKPYVIFLVLLFFGALYLLASVITPFLIGALLAYLVNPIVGQLARLKIKRLPSVVIVFAALFLLVSIMILLFIPVLQSQIEMFSNTLPNIADWVTETLLPWASQWLGSQEYINIATMKTALTGQWGKAGSLITHFFNTLLYSSIVLITWLLNLIIIPVVTFYLLRDWDQFISGVHDLIPRKIEGKVMQLTTECDAVLSAFFRGQLLVMLSLGIIYAIGLTLAGLKIGILLGLIIGLISIVPYLGFILGIIIASIACYVQFSDLNHLLYVWAVFAIGQSAEAFFLTPNLIGDRIGLHPVAVIFAVLAGGCLFGFLGVLLALPAASILMVGIRHAHQQYRESPLYQ